MNTNYNQEIGSDHERIYYNCRLDNQINNISNSATSVAVYDKQSQNILERQSEYEMAVHSYSIRAKLPIFIAPIVQGANTDINAMPYSVCYSYTDPATGVNTNFKQDLVWSADFAFNSANPDRTTPLPRTPAENNGIQDLFTSPNYYYCNSYLKFLDIVNLALLRAWIAFNTAHPAIHTEAVWVQYDAKTGLFALVGERSMATGAGGVGANKAQVFMDTLLYKYFDGIRADFNGYDQPNGKDYGFIFEQLEGGQNAWSLGNHYAGLVPNVTTNPPLYLIMEQETDLRYLWNNIKQIIISTDSINVRTEFMPFIELPQQINKSINNRFNQPRKSILSYEDYNVKDNWKASIHRDIYYEPLFYKWIDLVSDNVLNNIQLEIFAQTEEGAVLAVNIPRNSVCDVKLCFRKKN